MRFIKYDPYSSLINDFKDEFIHGEKVSEVERIKVKLERLDDFKIIEEFDTKKFQDEKNEGKRDLYINDFLFPPRPVLEHKI